MAQDFWSDKPLTITISGKSPNNSGIPKIDITGEKGIICGPNITSTTTSLNSSVSNNRAGSSANSVSTKFYASCEWDNPRILTDNINTYGNLPGCGKSTGNIKVKVWWDSVKKGDSSDDTYVEQTISNVTIKNAVETIDITGLSYSNGNPIPFKNGAYALDGYHEYEGVYLNYTLRGEYHKPKFPNSLDITYMPIYDSTVSVNINNTYSDSYTCVTPGTVEQYIINGRYFIPTKFNESTSVASIGGSIDIGDIDNPTVKPGDTVATPFPAGTFQIKLQAIGGHRQPSTAVTLDVVVSSGPDYQGDYLTLSALEDGEITITIPDMVDQNYAASISYSKDKSNWTETVVDSTEQTITIPVSNGDDVYLKGVADAWCNDDEEVFTHINSSANINASGNIMSLLYGDGFKDKTTFPEESVYIFGELFNSNTHLINAENLILPATTLTSYCYYNMFGGCTSLTTTPELPATTLAEWCYASMFAGCTSLTTAPALPAITAVSSCYDYMFTGCTSLENAPELPATTLNDSCYSGMFSGCTSLTAAPELPATTLAEWCYQSMFLGCTSLTAAPELPATTLYGNCYRSMFLGCTSLTHAPALPATTLANYCYYNTFKNCTSLVQAPALPATSLLRGCYYEMFYGCTSLIAAPELPSTELAPSCYTGMFLGCTSLTSAPELPATTLTGWCYASMFDSCTSLTQAPELPATNLIGNCYNSMFRRCTSLTTAPELPATDFTDLTPYCYFYMFKGCSKLNYVKAMFITDQSLNTYLNHWLEDVSSTGTFVKSANATWTNEDANIPSGWTVETV